MADQQEQQIVKVEILLLGEVDRVPLTIPRNADLMNVLLDAVKDIRKESKERRFQFSGKWIVAGDTPTSRGIENNDIIESRFYDQMKDGDDEILTLRIGGKYDPHAEFRYNRHTRLHRALIEYCNKKGLDFSQTRFWYDCQMVTVSDTPHRLQMHHRSKILVFSSKNIVAVRMLSSDPSDYKVFMGHRRDILMDLMRNYEWTMFAPVRSIEYRFRDHNLAPMGRLSMYDENLNTYHIKTKLWTPKAA